MRSRSAVTLLTAAALACASGVSHEVAKGSAGGIAEVKATSRLLPDGRLHVKSRHLRNGQWEDGRETFYVEDPQAVVRFKE